MLPVDRGRVLRALLALPLLALPAALEASGFALESPSARCAGLSGACVAQAADASALHGNAAGIAFLKQRSLSIGGSFSKLTTDFTGEGPDPAAGTLESADRSPGARPGGYYAQPLGDKLVLGLGVDAPFAFRGEWTNPAAFSGRFIGLDTRIDAWSVNPTLAIRLADRLALGFGADLRFSKFQLARRLLANPNPFPVPTDVAALRLVSRTSLGVGWNVGVLASPTEELSLGLAYRHKITIDHDGDAAFSQILTGTKEVDDAVSLGLPKNQLATASFTYPGSLAAGVAWKRKRWTVEGDVVVTLWSKLDAITLVFPSSPSYDSSLAQTFADSWRVALGAEYLIGEVWEARAGYSYDHSPQPATTLSPILFDESRHGLTLGGTYKHDQLRLDAFLGLVVSGGRSTGGLSTYGYDGLYKTKGFTAGASLGYRF